MCVASSSRQPIRSAGCGLLPRGHTPSGGVRGSASDTEPTLASETLQQVICAYAASDSPFNFITGTLYSEDLFIYDTLTCDESPSNRS